MWTRFLLVWVCEFTEVYSVVFLQKNKFIRPNFWLIVILLAHKVHRIGAHIPIPICPLLAWASKSLNFLKSSLLLQCVEFFGNMDRSLRVHFHCFCLNSSGLKFDKYIECSYDPCPPQASCHLTMDASIFCRNNQDSTVRSFCTLRITNHQALLQNWREWYLCSSILHKSQNLSETVSIVSINRERLADFWNFTWSNFGENSLPCSSFLDINFVKISLHTLLRDFKEV